MSEETTHLDGQLAAEYRLLFDRVTAFNSSIHNIRAWLVAALGVFSALVTLTSATAAFQLALLVVAWNSEGLIRASQSRLFPRIEKIEAHFRGTRLSHPFQSRTSAMAELAGQGKIRSLLRKMFSYEAGAFYILVLGAIILFNALPRTALLS